MKGRVLIIAGSDPSGGAGIQADVKTVTALGGYATTAITALTVQNTTGVSAVHPTAPGVIADQIDAVLGDIGADAVKIGMLGDADAANAVADALDPIAAEIPIVVDPVMIATSGDPLATADAVGVLKDRLLPMAALVTPNAPEAAALTTLAVATTDDLVNAGARLRERSGARACLVKGGHVEGELVSDILLTAQQATIFSAPRIRSSNTHGTGCTLASAASAGLAQGLGFQDAVYRAIAFVREALRTAPGYGAGNGPLNHTHTARAFAPDETGVRVETRPAPDPREE